MPENIQHGQKRPRFPNKGLFIGAAALNLAIFWLGFWLGGALNVT